MIGFSAQQKSHVLRDEDTVKEEWVELTDGKRKIIMPRRKLTNLARRISRVFATVKVIDPPLDVNRRASRNVRTEPLFRHHCFDTTVSRSKKNLEKRNLKRK